MVTQYDDDRELKFKQTDLRSTMTDLFVDLPIRRSGDFKENSETGSSRFWSKEVLLRVRRGKSTYFENIEYGDSALAVEYFSSQSVKSRKYLPRVVLEGAPGQGKSTVTQFLCQIMRIHLLNKQSELIELPNTFKNLTVRIPFRVDLRDLAKWLAGIDPFRPKDVELDGREPKSLEGFLAAQVRFESGGHEFFVADLTAIAKASHILLALDGFDEVADVNLRQKIVTEITKGCTRLANVGGFSLQTIVTSRPAAFAKSIRFPQDEWAYFELLPLHRKQVDNYTRKWMCAKGIKELEQSKLVRLLDVKLLEPHTQFLAKNPMQLTILLSLIHNRGASLPEKRTAMYDAYMDMFFSREAEKSDVVRDNRDLLIDIHRYLAWKLQTDAEAGGNGSIEQGALRETLLLYLDREGESTAIVSELFNGIIERVGALVSRVQETYEFEVQPLREYFAARYLYETAPYSPAGNEKAGTKLDRFNALIRNPYWLNVARFYGGCFSKGEISALVDQIQELCSSTDFGLTSHPRSVALMLLGDWVFTQYQPAVKRIVGLISERPQLRQLLAHAEEASGSGWSVLPDRGGRLDFVGNLWACILETSYLDEQHALAAALYKNASLQERIRLWKNVKDSMDYSDWVALGNLLKIFEEAPEGAIEELTGTISNTIITSLLKNKRIEYLEKKGLESEARAVILHKGLEVSRALNAGKPYAGRLFLLSEICSHWQYCYAVKDEHDLPFREILEHKSAFNINCSGFYRTNIPREISGVVLSRREKEAVNAYQKFLNYTGIELGSSLTPWIELVSALRGAWGDSPLFDRVAFIAAGVRTKVSINYDGRLADADDLVTAARFVRLKSGAPKWWQRRLTEETDAVERLRLLSLLLLWGTPRTILLIKNSLASALRLLSAEEWLSLYRNYLEIRWFQQEGEDHLYIKKDEATEIASLDCRLATFVGLRSDQAAQTQLALAIAESTRELSYPEVQFSLDAVLKNCRDEKSWADMLPFIKFFYKQGGTIQHTLAQSDYYLTPESARMVSQDLDSYPLPILALVDNQLRAIAGVGAAKLYDVAEAEGWFSI